MRTYPTRSPFAGDGGQQRGRRKAERAGEKVTATTQKQKRFIQREPLREPELFAVHSGITLDQIQMVAPSEIAYEY